VPRYLGMFKDRISIAAFLRSGSGLIAGILERNGDGRLVLDDNSGVCDLPAGLQVSDRLPAWVAVRLDGGGGATLEYSQPIADHRAFQRLRAARDQLRKRWRVQRAIREFFHERHFHEIDTPVAVGCPGRAPYLDTFAVADRYLRTSPELHMKRLLAAGFDRIFQIAPCFRRGDLGRLHREEFLMLEWYRAFADLDTIAADLRDLLVALAEEAADSDYFRREPEIVSCAALFQRELGVTLRDHEDRGPLRACLAAKGIGFDSQDDWDTLYFLLFLNFIEPALGRDRPLILTDYPASQAALAKCAPLEAGALPTCYRFELYLRGVEIANAFYELTDAAEQRRRFEADREKRALLGKTVYALDEDFLSALAGGLPPAAGIALGVDRLVLSLLGGKDLEAVLPFPDMR